MDRPPDRFMTSRVNTFSDGERILALCQACANLVLAQWSHTGSPVDRPASGCDRCGAAQAELPGISILGWRAYTQRAVGGSFEKLLAQAYVEQHEPYGASWAACFENLATLLANGWSYTD